MDVLRARGSDYVLIGDHGSGVYVVDVTNPRAPALAGSLLEMDFLGGIHDVDVFADGAGRPHAVVTGDRGMHVIHLDDPGSPAIISTINGSFGDYKVVTAYHGVVFEARGGGTWALLSDYTSGMHLVDVTDPHNPRYEATIPTRTKDGANLIPGSDNAVVASPDGRVYALVPSGEGIRVVDLTEPGDSPGGIP